MNTRLLSAIGLIGLGLTALASVANAETQSHRDWRRQIQTAANEASRNQQFIQTRQSQTDAGLNQRVRVRERDQVRANAAAANQAKQERAMRREQLRRSAQSGPQATRTLRGSGKMQRGKD